MRKRASLPWTIACLVAALTLGGSAAVAELATPEERARVCENWLTFMVQQQGEWAGQVQPGIRAVQAISEDGVDLGSCYAIAPRGYVVVPSLKELPPVKIYSEDGDLDITASEGLPRLVRDMLALRTELFVKTYGSLDAVQAPGTEPLFGTEHRRQWDRLLVAPDTFRDAVTSGSLRTETGPLLTSSWHQGAPYNNNCPMGDGGRCVVGCVATAAAMIMHYWQRPVSGIGSHSYDWDGDQSCEGDVGGGTLSATFSDTYDWANMPDNCGGGCSAAEQAALAELSYEVGVAFQMDYGACGSGASTSYAQTVFPTYFGYDGSINRQNRVDNTPEEWFQIIKNEINAGRPMQYRIVGHSIVCDGWRDTDGTDEYHINYGWGGTNTGWCAIDGIPGTTDPETEEYLIRNIIPPANQPPVAVCKDHQAHPANEQCELTVGVADIDDGSGDPDGAFDIASLCITAVDGVPVGCQQEVVLGGVGTYELTLTITDGYGASDACTATVDVLNETPVVGCVAAHTDFADEDCCILVELADLDDGSHDPDGASDVAAFGITELDGVPIASADEIEVCGVGDHAVTITMTDWCGASASCTSTVTVVDVTPPDLSVAVDRDVLWPPNHKMVNVTAIAEAADNCDPDPEIVLVEIDCNEPADGLGDGHALPDWVVLDDTHFQFRSERLGGGDGRVYTIVYTATDASGNSTTESVAIRVPHDDTGLAIAFSGFTAEGTGLDAGRESIGLFIPSTPAVMGTAEDGAPLVVQPAFDAAQVDPAHVYIGNTAGIVRTSKSIRTDFDRNGLQDLVVYFPTRTVLALQEYVFSDGGVDDEEAETLGLHYETVDADFLVSDILALGGPLIQPLDALPGDSSLRTGQDDPAQVLQTSRQPGADAVPARTGITAVYPNPFNPVTTIHLSLRTEARVVLNLYDSRGVLIRQLRNQTMPAGTCEVMWDGTDGRGQPVAAGVYLVEMVAGNVRSTRKLALIK